MSGGGQNTSTTTSGPPAQFLQQYSGINQQAQNVAAQPYQPYQGSLQAPLSPDQLSAINTIQNSQGIAQPYINNAAGFINASTAPLAPTIQPYLNQAQGDFQSAAAQPLSQIAATGTGWANQATVNSENTASGLPGAIQPGINAADAAYNASGQTAAGLPGSVQGGINAADNLYSASSQKLNPTQFSAGQVGQYESPYTNAVVNATQAEFNNQNAQQQQQVAGNAISQGAFGGDRAGVAAGITAGQEQLAQAPVIAGLENTGYSQALGEFNTQQQTGLQAQQATQQLEQGAGAGILAGGQQKLGAQTAEGQLQQGQGAGLLSGNQQMLGAQTAEGQLQQGAAGLLNQSSAQNVAAAQAQGQLGIAAGQGITGLGAQELGANEANAWLNSQAGYGMANLGQEALGTSLTGANAEMGAGNLQQSQAQTALNIPYEQYTAAQAYPFQTTGWQANIAEGLGGASGGTGTTTTPGPSVGSQVAGGALTATGILGMTGGFGSNGYLSNAFGSSGGSGIVDAGTFADARGGAVPARRAGGGGISVPGGGINIPTGAPDVSMSVVPGASGMGDSSGHTGPNLMNSSTGSTTTSKGGGDSTFGSLVKGVGDIAAAYWGGPAGAIAANELGSQVHFAKGGSIATASRGIHVRRAPGGGIDMDVSSGMDVPYEPGMPGPVDVPDLSAGLGLGAAPPAPHKGGHHGGIMAAMPVPPIPPDQPPPQQGQGIAGPPAPPPGVGAGAPNDQPTAQGQPAQDQPPTVAGHKPWEALLAAGLGIMGGTSPHAMTNIGRGGMQGLQFSEQQRVRDEQNSLAQLQQQETAKYHTGELDTRNKQIEQTGDLTRAQQAQTMALHQSSQDQAMDIAKMHLGMEGANLAETRRYHDQEMQHQQDALNLGKYTYQQVTQPDPDDPTKTLSGVMKLPTRGDEQPTFIRTNTDPNKAGAGGVSGREAIFFNRVTASGNEAATALKNISELPLNTSTGWFGGRQQGAGLLAAAKESLTNTLTPQSVQDYNTMTAGVSRNLSTIEAAGLAPPGSLTHSMDSIILKEGDTPLTQMRKMAEMRQIIEKGLEPNLSNPRIPQQQRDAVTSIIKQVQAAVPFTQHDVTTFQTKGQHGQSLADYASGNNLGGQSGSMATKPTGAAQQQAAAPVDMSPKLGEVQDGYRYLGGDPANPKSWQRQ